LKVLTAFRYRTFLIIDKNMMESGGNIIMKI
jgi:hypothetical protein